MGTDPSLMDQAKQQTQEVVHKTQEVAGQVMERARDQVKTQLADQKERAAGSLESVAQALRTTGEQLRGQDQSAISGYAESAAEMVERFSGYLQNRDIDELIGEVERFARRQPGLFLAGAFAMGFAASRFFKSSSPYGSWRADEERWHQSYRAADAHPLPTAYQRASETATSYTAAPSATVAYEPATTAAYQPAGTTVTADVVADDEEETESYQTTGTRRE
jgi:hypothetical protein